MKKLSIKLAETEPSMVYHLYPQTLIAVGQTEDKEDKEDKDMETNV